MKAIKIITGVTGAIAATIGVLLVAVSIGVASWVGRSETVDLPGIEVRTDRGAVVVEDFEIFDRSDRVAFIDDLGDATITVRSPGGEEVFVGIADRSTVRSIVGDLEIDGIENMSWVAADRGSTASVGFDFRQGEWSLVMVGPGAEALDLTIDAEVTAAPLRAAAAATGTLGAGIALIGGLLLWVALRREPRGTLPPSAPAVPATA